MEYLVNLSVQAKKDQFETFYKCLDNFTVDQNKIEDAHAKEYKNF